MAANNEHPDSIAAAIAQVSENLTSLVHDEIELAKAEVFGKVSSLARGAAAVAAGAVFGVFAVIFLMLTVAWVLASVFDSHVGKVWLGFAIVFAALVMLALGAFWFAWRKLRVGAPTPKMAIDEAKKIRDTVSSSAASTAPAAGAELGSGFGGSGGPAEIGGSGGPVGIGSGSSRGGS